MISRILLDTNILLDVAQDGRPQHQEATALFHRASQGSVLCCTLASSLKDFYYIARRGALAEELCREWVGYFLEELEILGVDRAACADALASDERDFENGIIRAVCEREHVDFLITRDFDALASSTIPSLDARTFLAQGEPLQTSLL